MKKTGSRVISLIVALMLALSLATPAMATEAPPQAGELCTQHTGHDEACGYGEASPCTHQHDADCAALAADNDPGDIDVPDDTEEPDDAAIGVASVASPFDTAADELAGMYSFAKGEIASADEIDFPNTLTATATGGGALKIENVGWAATKRVDTDEVNPVFDPTATGIYIFTAVLPAGYALADNAALPTAQVIVRADEDDITTLQTTYLYADLSEGAIEFNVTASATTVSYTEAGGTPHISEAFDADTQAMYVTGDASNSTNITPAVKYRASHRLA